MGMKVILECLTERIRNSKKSESFTITTIEMRAFNLVLKHDIYDKQDKVTENTKEKMDLLYDKAIMLNYNTWCSNFNNSIKISISDYFKEFECIIDDMLEIKVDLNDSIGNLEELQMVKQQLKNYI